MSTGIKSGCSIAVFFCIMQLKYLHGMGMIIFISLSRCKILQAISAPGPHSSFNMPMGALWGYMGQFTLDKISALLTQSHLETSIHLAGQIHTCIFGYLKSPDLQSIPNRSPLSHKPKNNILASNASVFVKFQALPVIPCIYKGKRKSLFPSWCSDQSPSPDPTQNCSETAI